MRAGTRMTRGAWTETVNWKHKIVRTSCNSSPFKKKPNYFPFLPNNVVHNLIVPGCPNRLISRYSTRDEIPREMASFRWAPRCNPWWRCPPALGTKCSRFLWGRPDTRSSTHPAKLPWSFPGTCARPKVCWVRWKEKPPYPCKRLKKWLQK